MFLSLFLACFIVKHTFEKKVHALIGEWEKEERYYWETAFIDFLMELNPRQVMEFAIRVPEEFGFSLRHDVLNYAQEQMSTLYVTPSPNL